jgi:hypothetical protein
LSAREATALAASIDLDTAGGSGRAGQGRQSGMDGSARLTPCFPVGICINLSASSPFAMHGGDDLRNGRPLRPDDRDGTKRKRGDQDARQKRLASCFPLEKAEIHHIDIISFSSCRQYSRLRLLASHLFRQI